MVVSAAVGRRIVTAVPIVASCSLPLGRCMAETLLGLRGGDKGGEVGGIGLGLSMDIQVARGQVTERRPGVDVDGGFFA